MTNLIGILERYATNFAVKLIRRAPEFTRETLDQLLQEDPEAFEAIVPQGIDNQTGLYAKQYFEGDLLPHRLSEAERNGVPVSYVLIDTDNLKKANDTGGHEAGDAVIKYVADLVNISFRMRERRKKRFFLDIIYFLTKGRGRKSDNRAMSHHEDLVARIGKAQPFSGRVGYGDEFGLLLYGCNHQQAIEIMSRFIGKVREGKARYRQNEIPVTVSVGIAQYENGISPQELIKRADDALYKAKESGKNRIMSYSPN